MMNKSLLENFEIKAGFTSHMVPLKAMAGVQDSTQVPQVGDLMLAQVVSLGHHRKLEVRGGVMWHIFPGDLVVGAFGNRYATDQFEAYVPSEAVTECDLVSVGGVFGKVVSRHPSMDTPTRLQIRGAICDLQGKPINLRHFSLPSHEKSAGIILVIGSSMNSGKTTTVGTLVRGLRLAGYRVAAAKITGTAAGKDGRYFTSCGARPVLDFTHAGYPSTYMLSLEELLRVHRTLTGHLADENPDYIVVEIADGIFQRETRMLLESREFRQTVEHVMFAANDSLSAECGVRCVKEYGLPLRALSGVFTQSALTMREAEAATGIRCLNIEQMVNGGALEALGIPNKNVVQAAEKEAEKPAVEMTQPIPTPAEWLDAVRPAAAAALA